MATEPLPDRDELVEVFSTKEESEAQVVRGLLESNGIEALALPLEAPQDILPGVGPIVVRVPASQATDARNLIEEYRTSAAEDADFEGDEDGGEPTPAA